MIAAAQGKSLSLAGLMPPCSGFKTLAKLSFSFTNKENDFPRIAGGMNHIATSDGRAAWDFETSTREFKDTLANCRTVTREFSGTLEASFVTSTRDGCHTCSKEFCESIKKGLMCPAIPVYGYSAPAKSGAGIGVLVIRMATHDAPSVFFCVVSLTHPFFERWDIIQRLARAMVAQAGASSEAPVSIRAGYANPAWATTSEIGVSGGSVTRYRMEAAAWLLPSPKFRNLSGLSPLFAAICRQLPQKFTISPQLLSVKLAVLWFGITSAFSLVASVWRWLMRNNFRITGYAVNKRGLTVGIGYQLTSSDTKTAMAHAVLQAQREGLSHVRITRVQEVAA
ncbi:ash family protein [Klebsiella pneumoniae]|uniref:ash family protein n=1 Tax=Klebsiella quasipneumoniae TaxID=1463165 RepID=UPI001C2CA9BA|nr:ash family protein [Klebsiella quasipneumoniae]HCU1183166.1 ash family protein [Klebsiella pneumoniae]HDU3524968.1 ash family protein [Klebsiella pneumoniae]